MTLLLLFALIVVVMAAYTFAFNAAWDRHVEPRVKARLERRFNGGAS